MTQKPRNESVKATSRRTALRAIAAGAVGAAASSDWVETLTALARQQSHTHPVTPAAKAAGAWTPRVLTARQNDTVVALTELIIPATDTPGATAAGVNRFIDAVLHRASATERDAFLRGLTWFDARSRALYKKDFTAAAPADQTALVASVADVAGAPAPRDRAGADFFRALKSMTIDGYYTSEIGMRQELGDDGQLFHAKFEGCTHEGHG